jgi:hypothetical protein
MRYFTAVVIPIGFVVAVFSALAVLTWLADGWSLRAQDVLAEAVVWWARYWWMIGLVLAAACLILAMVHDALAPAKRTRR